MVIVKEEEDSAKGHFCGCPMLGLGNVTVTLPAALTSPLPPSLPPAHKDDPCSSVSYDSGGMTVMLSLLSKWKGPC